MLAEWHCRALVSGSLLAHAVGMDQISRRAIASRPRSSKPSEYTYCGAQTHSRLLTVPEAAEALGLRCATIRAWIYRRKIPYVRVNGRAVRIAAAEVYRIIARGTVPALPDREVGQ